MFVDAADTRYGDCERFAAIGADPAPGKPEQFAELIRRGAPLYLKFGLSKAPGIYPYGHHLRDLALSTARERVRRGRLALDLLARHGADGDMAPLGSRLPGDLIRFDIQS